MLGSTPSEGAHKAFSGAHYCPDSATGLADLGCLTQALRSALADQKDSRAAAVCLEAFFVYEDPSQRKNLAIGAVAEVCGLCVQALGRDGGGAEVRCPPRPRDAARPFRSPGQAFPGRLGAGWAGRFPGRVGRIYVEARRLSTTHSRGARRPPLPSLQLTLRALQVLRMLTQLCTLCDKAAPEVCRPPRAVPPVAARPPNSRPHSRSPTATRAHAPSGSHPTHRPFPSTHVCRTASCWRCPA